MCAYKIFYVYMSDICSFVASADTPHTRAHVRTCVRICGNIQRASMKRAPHHTHKEPPRTLSDG